MFKTRKVKKMACLRCGIKSRLIPAPMFGKNVFICSACKRELLGKKLKPRERTSPLKNTGCTKVYDEVQLGKGFKTVCRGWI